MILAQPDGLTWQRRYRQPALEIVNEYIEDDHVRAFMPWMAFMTAQPIDRPHTRTAGLCHRQRGRQCYSRTTPKGGLGSLPMALASIIDENGGVVQGGKRVVEFLLHDGQCTGVVTEDGQEYMADKAALSTIHIKHLADMAPRAAWGVSFLNGLQSRQPGFTLFAGHYALTEPPMYPIDGERMPSVAASIAGSTDNMLALMGDIRRGRIHQDTPVLLIVCSSVVDPTRVPQGKHVLKVLSFFPYQRAHWGPARWGEIKDDIARTNLEYLRKFAPNLTGAAILGSHFERPVDLERRDAHNWHGRCHGGGLSPAQSGAMRPVPGWASHRLPIAGLYQRGGTTHPGDSVPGGPGRSAARGILEDLGLSLETTIVAGKGMAHA